MISYMEVYANFCIRIVFAKKFVINVIRFRGLQNQRKHVQGNDIQDALSLLNAIIHVIPPGSCGRLPNLNPITRTPRADDAISRILNFAIMIFSQVTIFTAIGTHF